MGEEKPIPRYRISILKLIAYILLFILASAFISFMVKDYLPGVGWEAAPDYAGYINILAALAFGYLIVSAFANLVYWSMMIRHDHPSALATRNAFVIIGIGAMIAAIAGAYASGAAGVALGGFIGMVVGFASQQVLGQAVAGLFLLITRPFKMNQNVNIAGEEGTVKEVSTLFTMIKKPDGTKTLIPNNMIVSQKIHLKPKEPPKENPPA